MFCTRAFTLVEIQSTASVEITLKMDDVYVAVGRSHIQAVIDCKTLRSGRKSGNDRPREHIHMHLFAVDRTRNRFYTIYGRLLRRLYVHFNLQQHRRTTENGHQYIH